MKKLLKTAVPVVALLAVIAAVLYHTVGWYKGDAADYIRENYEPQEEQVSLVEFMEAGEDGQGGLLIYRITTESGSIHYVRVHVVYHRYLTRVGPDFRIIGIEELLEYDLPDKQMEGPNLANFV